MRHWLRRMTRWKSFSRTIARDGERIELYACASHLDEDIKSIDANDFINGAERSFVGAARAYKRKFLIKFPNLNSSLQTEDTPLLLRSIMSGPIATSLKPVVKRRIHGANLSSTGFRDVNSVKAIEKQYDIDLSHALELGLITSEQKKQFRLGRTKTRAGVICMQ